MDERRISFSSWIDGQLYSMYATHPVQSLLGNENLDCLTATATAKLQHVSTPIEALRSRLVRFDDIVVSMEPRDSFSKHAIESPFQQMQVFLPLGGLLYGC